MQECGACGRGAPDVAAYCPGCGKRLGRAVPPQGASGGKTAVIIVLAVAVPFVLAIVGIIAAIAIPNLLTAIQRGKQKRAVTEIKAIATAAQTYAADNKHYPIAGPGAGTGARPGAGSDRDSGWSFVEVREVSKVLAPDYLKAVPELDPWNAPYLFGSTPDGASFCVISTGKDRSRDAVGIPEGVQETGCFESDIVWVDESFARAPGGKQRQCGKGGE